MSEAGFRIFAGVFSIGAELFYAAGFALFVKPFLTKRVHRGRTLLAVFLIYPAVRLICSAAGMPQGTSGILLIILLILLAGPLGLVRETAALPALLYWNARVLDGLMMESLYFLLERHWFPGAGSPEMIYLRSVLLILMFLVSHGTVLVLMLYLLQRQIKKQPLLLSWRELCCIGLIPAAGILFGQIVSGLLFEIREGSLPGLYERHPAFLAVIPLLALLFLAGTFLTIASRQEMEALRREEAARAVERQQEQAIRARLQETEQFYQQIRRMKHEMRGHMANIRGLAQSRKYADLEAYIARMEGEAPKLELEMQTGNLVTDVIINDKRQQCLKEGILFQADFRYPEGGEYQAFDIGIILQNLLQNALEAARKAETERFITLTGRRKGRFFLIEVKNAYAGEAVFGEDGLPATTKKEDRALHGIGLANVRRIAESYMGEAVLKADRQEFSAAVLLQERSSYEQFDRK